MLVNTHSLVYTATPQLFYVLLGLLNSSMSAMKNNIWKERHSLKIPNDLHARLRMLLNHLK